VLYGNILLRARKSTAIFRRSKLLSSKYGGSDVKSRQNDLTCIVCDVTCITCDPTHTVCYVTKVACGLTCCVCGLTREVCDVTRDVCNLTKNVCGLTRHVCEITGQACEMPFCLIGVILLVFNVEMADFGLKLFSLSKTLLSHIVHQFIIGQYFNIHRINGHLLTASHDYLYFIDTRLGV
jgi:hypothetical protein